MKKPTRLAAFILLLIFIIDLIAPLQIAVGILYILCFFLICTQTRKTIITFAIITFCLAITKFIIFYKPDTSYMIYINRGLMLMTISILTVLSLRYRTFLDNMNSERLRYERQLEEMLLTTTHEVRRPLANFFGLLNLFEADKTLSESEQNYIISNLKMSATELDTFTKKLTLFLASINRNQIRQV